MNNKKQIHDETYGKYGCWWEGGTGVSPEGNQCGECYPNYEEKCPHLLKHRQIYEISRVLCQNGFCTLEEWNSCELAIGEYCTRCRRSAERLYNAGYYKQNDGEWIFHNDGSGTCKNCNTRQMHVWDMDNFQSYCGHCGAQMKGGAE